MHIDKHEKVMSLAKTTGVVFASNPSMVWGELFGYVFLACLYQEGVSKISPRYDTLALNSECYSAKLGQMIEKGLRERIAFLEARSATTALDKTTLEWFKAALTRTRLGGSSISARKIIGTAVRNNVSDDMKVVAHYVAMMIGTTDFPKEVTLPFIYISLFGNIYLSGQYSVRVQEPTSVFLSTLPDGRVINPLTSFISSFARSLTDEVEFGSEESIVNGVRPVGSFDEVVSSYNFAGLDPADYAKTFLKDRVNTIPQQASVNVLMDLTQFNPLVWTAPAELFYENIFTNARIAKTNNAEQFKTMLDDVVRDADAKLPVYLRARPDSDSDGGNSCVEAVGRHALLAVALEAMGDEDGALDDENTGADDQTPKGQDDPEATPEDTGSADDSAGDTEETDSMDQNNFSEPTPEGGDENSIGRISFDTSGESDDADLYRKMVLALNDRIQADDQAPVTSDARRSLNMWVNYYLYRTPISATQRVLENLGLSEFIESV
jgi:hypothetical protein